MMYAHDLGKIVNVFVEVLKTYSLISCYFPLNLVRTNKHIFVNNLRLGYGLCSEFICDYPFRVYKLNINNIILIGDSHKN